MINVSTAIQPKKVTQCKVGDLIRTNYSEHANAFIGKCGFGPPNSLYIVTYDSIILASNPGKAWDREANVTVDRFVDLDIKIVEQ